MAAAVALTSARMARSKAKRVAATRSAVISTIRATYSATAAFLFCDCNGGCLHGGCDFCGSSQSGRA